jgi:FkbM family methyltransferase
LNLLTVAKGAATDLWRGLKFDAVMREFRTLSAYCARFGLVSGFFIFEKLYRGPAAEISVKIPEYPIPITIRRKTSDVSAFEQVFVKLQYELAIDGQPKLIIDGGANVGYTTIYFANRWPRARIVAVEPEASNYAVLQKNVAAYPNVTAVQAALWSKRTYLEIQNPGDDNWAFRVRPSEARNDGSFEAITVQELIERAGSDRVDILKLDIEGAEKEVFSSDYSWLKNVQAMVLELHDWITPGCSKAVYSAARQYSFKDFPQGENIVFVRNPPPEERR